MAFSVQILDKDAKYAVKWNRWCGPYLYWVLMIPGIWYTIRNTVIKRIYQKKLWWPIIKINLSSIGEMLDKFKNKVMRIFSQFNLTLTIELQREVWQGKSRLLQDIWGQDTSDKKLSLIKFWAKFQIVKFGWGGEMSRCLFGHFSIRYSSVFVGSISSIKKEGEYKFHLNIKFKILFSDKIPAFISWSQKI